MTQIITQPEHAHDAVLRRDTTTESATVRRVRQFLAEGKSCCRHECLQRVHDEFPDALWQFGEDMAACSHEAKEAALLMNLREHLYTTPSPRDGGHQQRIRVAYSLPPFGRMCRQAYVLLWGIGLSTLRALLSYMKQHANSICPRTHGLVGKAPNHALPPQCQQHIIDWILKLGEQIGEEDEGRQSRRERHHIEGRVVRFLPASYTIAGLYRLFVEQVSPGASEKRPGPPVSFSTFRMVFLSPPCQHIRLRSPRSNVCDECAMYRAFYRQHPTGAASGQSSVHEEDRIHQWQAHIQVAREAREAYNADLQQARQTRELLSQGKLPLAGYVAHYTFDFMQSLALPQFADQTKEMYYFSLRKIHLFSIRDDGAQVQYNYLYDEGEGGKGANYVISLLFHFLRHRTPEAAALVMHLHADNCCGQNKNNRVMQFFVLLVSLGLLSHVEMKFLIKGHTHCSVDGGHGMIKNTWRTRDVFTLTQAAQVVEDASPTAGIHKAVIVTARDFFDWEDLLSRYFSKLPHLLSFQQFGMDAMRPGRLRYRYHQTDLWEEASLFTSKIDCLPQEFSLWEALQEQLTPLSPPGIPIKKQHVLYEKVRKYVPPAYQDSLCPLPTDYQEKPGDEEENIRKES